MRLKNGWGLKWKATKPLKKIKKDIKEVLNPLATKKKSINLLFNKSINIKPKRPEKNPKFINPCGIQQLSISIMEIQINRDKNNQLKNILNNKFELVL